MYLQPAPRDGAAEALYRSDLESDGYVMNLTKLWAWRPDVAAGFSALRTTLMSGSSLSARERAVVVCATVGSLGDSYCALAWGRRLADASDPQTAADVLKERDASALNAREKALAAWARRVARSPNATSQADIHALREAGLAEREIFEATVLAAFRLAFSAVNDALGARPDHALAEAAPAAVRAAVDYGRDVDVAPAAQL